MQDGQLGLVLASGDLERVGSEGVSEGGRVSIRGDWTLSPVETGVGGGGREEGAEGVNGPPIERRS